MEDERDPQEEALRLMGWMVPRDLAATAAMPLIHLALMVVHRDLAAPSPGRQRTCVNDPEAAGPPEWCFRPSYTYCTTSTGYVSLRRSPL